MKQQLSRYFSFNDALLVGALLVGLALVWNTVTTMQYNYYLQQKYDNLKAEVDLQELQNQNLKYNIAYLKTDDYLELAARDKFNKAAPGENLVYLPDNGTSQSAPVAKNTAQPKKVEPHGWKTNVQSWWHFLQGKDSNQTI